MKKVKGKKLNLQKLNITKLNNMSSIMGGAKKSNGTRCPQGGKGDDDYMLHTQQHSCTIATGTTIIGF